MRRSRNSLTPTLRVLLVLLLVSGLGGVACKTQKPDIEPAQEPATAQPPRSTATEPRTEVQPDPFDSQGTREPGMDTGELDRVMKDEIQGQLDTIYFAYDKSELTDNAKRILEHNARVMQGRSGFVVVVEGHTDDRGTIEYNLALGQRRAESVRAYLMNLGVPGNQLRTVTYGEERPAAFGSGESSWSQNRRAAFVVE